MFSSHLVIAIGNNQQRVEFVNAAAEKLEQVQGSFVGPVNVFDYEDSRCGIL
jgi:hypothetical protein